jgi:hypothetical protein
MFRRRQRLDFIIGRINAGELWHSKIQSAQLDVSQFSGLMCLGRV